jgi:hypothetical protein
MAQEVYANVAGIEPQPANVAQNHIHVLLHRSIEEHVPGIGCEEKRTQSRGAHPVEPLGDRERLPRLGPRRTLRRCGRRRREDPGE